MVMPPLFPRLAPWANICRRYRGLTSLCLARTVGTRCVSSEHLGGPPDSAAERRYTVAHGDSRGNSSFIRLSPGRGDTGSPHTSPIRSLRSSISDRQSRTDEELFGMSVQAQSGNAIELQVGCHLESHA